MPQNPIVLREKSVRVLNWKPEAQKSFTRLKDVASIRVLTYLPTYRGEG
jgi:hypothetical protein